MNKLDYFIKSILTFFAIIIGAYLISSAMNNHTYYNRSIEVKGLSQRDVIATSGTWSLSIAVAGNDLSALNNQIKEQKEIVLQSLLKAGFKQEEIQADLPMKVEDKLLGYSFDREKQTRYVLSANLNLKTTEVEKLFNSTHLINDFLTQNIVFKGSTAPNFFFEKLNDIKPGMLKEAGTNAYTSAIELANNTKSKIGKIKKASQGAFEIQLRNETSEYNDSNKHSPYLKARVVINVTYFIAD